MDDREFIKQKLAELLKIVNELQARFPDRKFTLDGHLIGSIGEVLARYYYGIELAPTGTKRHDGTLDGKQVQIKITQRDSVDIKGVPENLLVLFLSTKDLAVYEVYNGPCKWLEEMKPNGNHEYTISLKDLAENPANSKSEGPIEKWKPGMKNE